MTISYDGLTLPAPTAAAADWVRAWVPASLCPGFLPRTRPAKDQPHLPQQPWLPGPVELGVLRWPSGASRWALGHYLADSVTAATLAAGSGPRPLVLADGTRSVTLQLYCLPPVPLSQCGGDAGLSLLTLVDERYFWWQRAADVAVTGGTTTWAGLYAALASALGAAIAADPVPAEYLLPPAQLAAHYEFLPPLLDAVAASVGQRVVRTFAGQVTAQNGASALASAAASLAAGWTRVAGGVLADVTAGLPGAVALVFPSQDTSTPPTSVASIVGSGPGTRVVRSTAIYTAATAAECAALAAQFADDWIDLQSGSWDVTFAGSVPWAPDACTDTIEFRQLADPYHAPPADERRPPRATHRTRVTRAGWDAWPETALHRSSAASPNATLAALQGASLTPAAGYYGATASSGDGTIGATGDSSASGAWIIKDGQVLHVGDLTINGPAGARSPGTSSITFTTAGNVTPTLTSDSLGNASLSFDGDQTPTLLTRDDRGGSVAGTDTLTFKTSGSVTPTVTGSGGSSTVTMEAGGDATYTTIVINTLRVLNVFQLPHGSSTPPAIGCATPGTAWYYPRPDSPLDSELWIANGDASPGCCNWSIFCPCDTFSIGCDTCHYCGGDPYSDTFTATVTDLANCTCLDGEAFTLTYDPGNDQFGATRGDLLCSGTEAVGIIFHCADDPGSMSVALTCTGVRTSPWTKVGADTATLSCDPLSAEFTVPVGAGGCCGDATASIKLTITRA